MDEVAARGDGAGTMPSQLGGRLCLDFINTVDPRHNVQRREYLRDYASLVAWSCHTGVLQSADAARLLSLAAREPMNAHTIVDQAVTLREALYRLFAAYLRGDTPKIPDIRTLEAANLVAAAHARLRAVAGGYAWDWDDDPALDRMLWPIVRDAAALLASPELARLRECPGNGDCGWLFLDTSKNHSRRWCRMEGCGNREKARRHYARQRTAE